MRDVITFAGRSLSDFNTFMDQSKSFGSPEKDYEIISIPGRNGDLSIYNNRFKDITVSIPCFIRDNFLENYRALMQYLNSVDGYQRFETSKEPEYFRKALFLGSVEPATSAFNKSGKFTLNFRLNPQRWLKSAEDWVDLSSEDIYYFDNPTNMPAKPIFRFYENGNIYVSSVDSSSGTDVFTVTGEVKITNNVDKYVDIDCETFDCYSESGGVITNRNADVTFDVDPIVMPGKNLIVYHVTNPGEIILEIIPRFFMI